MKFGIIITNRSFFPSHLVQTERGHLLTRLAEKGHEAILLDETETPLGAVMTLSDAKACATLFGKHRETIDGVLVILPNFGDETAVAETLDRAKLNVPILVVACDDNPDKLDMANRRDAFCGKLSVMNNLYQRGIRFTQTNRHTLDLTGAAFGEELDRFAGICRVVRGLSRARIGAIGARPDAFHTVRFSEKLLQASGITVGTVDLSEIIVKAQAMQQTAEVDAMMAKIRSYGRIAPTISEEKIVRQAKLALVLEGWVAENECDASAIQCWDSIQNNYGCATCLSMSMMGESGKPSACEMDVTGAVTMLALQLASGNPSAYLDWNNNWGADNNVCINLHCSNFPRSFFGHEDVEIGTLDVLGSTLGQENTFGAIKAQVAEGPMTFAKITTDDRNGRIKAYVGEGRFRADKVPTPGGVALCQVDNLQTLLHHMGRNGFEHHVAMNRGQTAEILVEAFSNYLGWEVYRHR